MSFDVDIAQVVDVNLYWLIDWLIVISHSVTVCDSL